MTKRFKIKFWGVRGSFPVPGQDTVKYGGNTPCVQIIIDDRILIFDAGTGIRKLGTELYNQQKMVEAEIFITHTHWDHIQGFPFFKPFYVRGNHFNIYGCDNIDKLLASQMKESFFPVRFKELEAVMEFTYLKEGDSIRIDDELMIECITTNHIGLNLAYRIESNGRSCCYLTDMEHLAGLDQRMIDFVRDADLLIYDAKYTDDEYYNSKIGWGHSTWQEGIKLVKAAGVKKLILFHHSPDSNDGKLQEIEKEARLVYPDTLAAREGMIISL